jgi:hypothetical protein
VRQQVLRKRGGTMTKTLKAGSCEQSMLRLGRMLKRASASLKETEKRKVARRKK